MITFKGKKYTTAREHHAQWMKNPEYKKAFHALDFEFALRCAIIKNRIKGTTQKQLAEKMGVSHVSLNRFELGMYDPKLSFIQKLITALNLKIKVS